MRFFSLYRWFNSFPAVRFLLAVKMFHVEQRFRLPASGIWVWVWVWVWWFASLLRSRLRSQFLRSRLPASLQNFTTVQFYPAVKILPVVKILPAVKILPSGMFCQYRMPCSYARPGSIFFAHFLLLFSSFVSASLSTTYKIAPVFWFFFSSPSGWFSCITSSVATLYIGFPVLLPWRFYFFGG